MPKFLNWTSVTFMATIVGLVIPIWLWRADLNAKSLAFQLASQVSLTAETAGSIKGLEVLMDGVKVQSPVLSVVVLTNDGKKPLPTADFEVPVELRIQEQSSIVRAEVVSTQPKDIEANITWDKKMIRFTPVLLNPEESITVSILTEGAKPAFTPRARIIGVSIVEFSDTTKKPPAWQRSVAFLFASILFFAVSDIADVQFWGGPKGIYVRRRAALLIKVLAGITGIAAFLAFFQMSDLVGTGTMFWSLIGTLFAGMVLGSLLNLGAKKIGAAVNAP